jgi:hypothetical protein
MKKSTYSMVIFCLIFSLNTLVGYSLGADSDKRKYNPYIGSLLDLLPKEVGKFSLSSTSRLDGHIKDLRCVDAIEAIYRTRDKRKVKFRIFSFSSAKRAISALQKYVSLAGSGPHPWKVESKRSKEGLVGKRVGWGDTVVWTNGALLCSLDIDPEDADPTVFEKELPY